MSPFVQIGIQRYIYLKSIASTNDFLYDYTSKSKPSENICVYSFNQTQGKGQIGRFWFSDVDKNISLSLFLPFSALPVKSHFILNKSICLVLRDFIASLLPQLQVKIKWPNDIYINNKKIAGILVQNQLKSHFISESIIGFGINVNQEVFPHDLAHATSLHKLTNQYYPLTKLVFELSNSFADSLQKYLSSEDKTNKQYLSHLWGLNQKIRYSTSNEAALQGTILGVDEDGKLMVDLNGQIQLYNNGDINVIL